MARRRPTEPTVNPARGAALVVVAVLLGLVLLRNGIDTSEVVTSTRDDGGEETDGATAEGADEGTDEGEETPTTVAVRPPAEVTVIVLNGTSTSGVAGTYSEAIGSAGYQMLEAGNATTQTPTTLVYFVEGFEAEAVAVATAAGVPATVSPAPMPDPPPGEVGAANVVVVIGTDIATLTPTTAAPDATTETTAAG
ncbi:MAG: LytR C-terminal domain-containing protein [Acidimicrobiia bacterium]|jgi:hypothetical protein